MKCIIVNDNFTTKNNLEELILKSRNLVLTGSFESTEIASQFIAYYPVDLLFIDIHTDDKNSVRFIKSIPENIYVVYVSYNAVKNNTFDLLNGLNHSIVAAQAYAEAPTKTENYFVI